MYRIEYHSAFLHLPGILLHMAIAFEMWFGFSSLSDPVIIHIPGTFLPSDVQWDWICYIEAPLCQTDILN